jgi:hypothetical protein
VAVYSHPVAVYLQAVRKWVSLLGYALGGGSSVEAALKGAGESKETPPLPHLPIEDLDRLHELLAEQHSLLDQVRLMTWTSCMSC